jgi:hypothetical protein
LNIERCPFCGREPIIATAGSNETGYRYGAYCNGSYDECDKSIAPCPATLEDPGWHYTEEQARDYWNNMIRNMVESFAT